MTRWNHDISAAPRGYHETKTRTVGDKKQNYDVFVSERILAVDSTGKVFGTYWVEPGKYSKNGRWSGWCEGQDPIAWAPWPTYDLKAAPGDAAVTSGNDLREPVAAEQGQIIREGDVPRETDRASGDASSPDTHHLYLEDVGSGA